MKLIVALSIVTGFAQVTFADAGGQLLGNDKRSQCHLAAVETLQSMRGQFQDNLQKVYGPELSVSFIVAGPIKWPEPVPAYLIKKVGPRKEGYIDDRHLIYGLGIVQDKKVVQLAGNFVVQCNGDDLTKIDDVNKDGKIDSKDIHWAEEIAAK